MGNYVDESLLPNEEVVARAYPHWAIFIAPGLVMLIGFATSSASYVFYYVGAFWAVFRFLVFSTTELALTTKRVIAKSGIIRRNVVDLSLSKVEGVTYRQGILGRIFGYGSIIVRGTGVGQVPIPFISKPESFKREVGTLIHA